MTKTVRIENADTASYKVRVRVEHKDAEGNWVAATKLIPSTGEGAPALVPLVHDLTFPTAMVSEYLTDSRRFIVEEYV